MSRASVTTTLSPDAHRGDGAIDQLDLPDELRTGDALDSPGSSGSAGSTDDMAALTPVPDDEVHRSESDPEVEALVVEHLDLARKLANRYSGRGEPLEELIQVARLGLVLAAQRYDPSRGTGFTVYAVPTILGELRRYFRDHCWSVRVPRPVHDLYLRIQQVQERMTTQAQRAPTVAELAAELQVREHEVIEALEGGSAYAAMSLDAPDRSMADDGWSLGDTIGAEDHELDLVEQREAVQHLLAQVPDRERTILIRSFFGNRTQAEIAKELGISQMHVSRLLASTLAKLRSAAFDSTGEPIKWPSHRRRRRAS